MVKTESYSNLDVELERMATRVQTYLQENKFEVAFSKDPTEPASWFFIQARKSNALRTVAGARRSTDITIKGEPNNFQVTIGTGEWGKNIITSAPLFIVPIVGITATLAKLYVAKRFEDNLWKYIRDQASFLRGSASSVRNRTSDDRVGMDSRAYDCDYVEGYPGWGHQILGGKLLIFRERGGKNKLVFKTPDRAKEIVVLAQDIVNASIITRKKGLDENDLMIRLECKEESGRRISPVLNLSDDIIRGVLAGINEIVGEDRGLRDIERAHVSTDTKYCSSCGSQMSKEANFCSSCGQKQ